MDDFLKLKQYHFTIMKSFHLNELAGFLGLFQKYTGAQLQEVVSAKDQLLLRFRYQQNYFLFFDLSMAKPVLFWLQKDIKLKKKTTPLALFLKKYFIDSVLQDVCIKNGEGRVLHFYFISKEHGQLEIEARLFPHGSNLIAKTETKSISWFKPKDLNTDVSEISPVANIDEIMQTKWEEYQDLSKPKVKKVDQSAKTKSLLERLENDLKNYPTRDYKSVADKVKATQNLNSAEDLGIDLSLAWYEAVKLLLEKDKKQVNKKLALSKRIEEVRLLLKEGKTIDQKANNDLFAAVDAKGRVKVLSDGRRAYVGKSAKDNMILLRKAKAWYLWMHVRDYPSGHLILQQNKGQVVSEADITELGLFLVKESGFSKSLVAGDMFDVQYTECRYIKPIKGDKLGRVHVQKEKVLRIRFKD